MKGRDLGLKAGKILLRGVEFYAYGGVTPEERKVGQRYSVNAEMVLDISRAAVTDDLQDTVSYAEAVHIVVQTAKAEPFNLLESLASRLGEALLEKFPIQGVTIQLHKLLPPVEGTVASAGIEISLEAPSARSS